MRVNQIIVFMLFLCLINDLAYSQNNNSNKIYDFLEQNKNRCLTETQILDLKFFPNGKAEVYNQIDNFNNNSKRVNQILIDRSWTKADSLFFDKLIPARANCGVKINKSKFNLELISAQNLTSKAKDAILKAPRWIRAELENTLSQLIPAKQDKFAQIILDSDDPYIDEIAFTIAHSSSVFLASDYCFPQLFLENAVTIYEHDKDLSYVEIIDYGSSSTDEEYYSTVQYYKIDKDSNKIKIEIPKEIYYWYIVHPKLSDEIPTYIYPDIIEYDYTIQNSPHTLNIASPEEGGVFWREFLYTVQDDIPDKPDEKLPQLKEQVSKCDVLFDETKKGVSAIKVITKWINDVMDFNSGYERPHQPVRIYRLHLGRCGEHEDITSAAARACLIPCRGISSWSTDHVWNEFWDEKWWQWEPVNNSIKDNMVYEAGWGKKFGSVIARRSDGLLIPVTEDYSTHTCRINIYALDINDKPIDGAFILVGMGPQNELRLDSYATTDSEGKYTLIVGKDNTYWAGMSSSLGNDPANGVKLLVENASEGETYNFSLKGNKAKQTVNYNKVDSPPNNKEDFKLLIDFELLGQITNWKNYLDDLPNTYCYGLNSSASINFFVSDEQNYEKSTINQRFDACIAEKDVNSFTTEFEIPDDGVWYAFLNNRNSNANYTQATGWFYLYYSDLVSIQSQNEYIKHNLKIYPNPFSNFINIVLENKGNTRFIASIYNHNGELIKVLNENLIGEAIKHLLWDGTDVNNKKLPSGLYFLKILGENINIFQKIYLIR